MREEIQRWRDAALLERDDLRPVATDALHVTLVFLGYRAEKEIPVIARTAFDALAGRRPPPLTTAGVVPLPPRRPRLFALDLEDPRGEAVALQGAASAALESARFYRPEKRPFWPHVTLARVKRNRRADLLTADPPPRRDFDAPTVTLYRSHLRPQGALYEPLERLELAA